MYKLYDCNIYCGLSLNQFSANYKLRKHHNAVFFVKIKYFFTELNNSKKLKNFFEFVIVTI